MFCSSCHFLLQRKREENTLASLQHQPSSLFILFIFFVASDIDYMVCRKWSWGKKKKRDERRTRQRELFATDIFGGISFVFIFSLHFKNETLVMSAQLSSSSLLIPSLFSLTSSTTSSYVYWWWFSSSLSFSPSFPVFLAHDDDFERERNSVPAIVSWNQVVIVWGQDLQSSFRGREEDAQQTQTTDTDEEDDDEEKQEIYTKNKKERSERR